MERSPLTWLDGAAVAAAMPPVAERLALAERTMTALVGEAELPPKIGVHPRPAGSFAHAMPAALLPRDGSSGGADDLLGIKWVTGFGSAKALGLPAIHAIVILSDPTTGEPRAILDGAGITALRTAAVSGVAIARFGPRAAVEERPAAKGPVRAAIIGAGVQGHSHLEVLGHVLPGVDLVLYDRHAERAADLAAAARRTPGIGGVSVATDWPDAVADADVVITAASFTTPDQRQALTEAAVRDDALVVAVDYATLCSASLARDAAAFLTDDRGQFLANRDAGQFDGYPDPTGTLGEAILAGEGRPPRGRVLVSHLGVGLADVVVADAIVARAANLGLGVDLAR